MRTRTVAVLVLVCLVCGCAQQVEPVSIAAAPEAGASSEPPLEVTLGAEPLVSVLALNPRLSQLGYLGSGAQCSLDGDLLEMSGGELRLATRAAGRHLLRIQVPGFRTRELVIVIDPQSPDRTLQVSLEAVEPVPPAGEAEKPADDVFVYDLY